MKKSKNAIVVFLFLITISTMTGFVSNNQIAIAAEKLETSPIGNSIQNSQDYEVKYSYKDILYEYYMDYCESDNFERQELSFDEFHDAYYEQSALDIYDFTEYLKAGEAFDANQIGVAPMGSGNPIYDPARNNIGTGPLPQRPNYGKTNLFDLWPGDILFDEKGFLTGTVGISGHIGMIEGKFLDPNYGFYWRIIESNVRSEKLTGDPGVSRHLLDDTRFINFKGHILRVKYVTDTIRQAAVDFALSQYGKDWSLQLTSRPTSSDVWMCSTLIWASYKNQGVDISPGLVAVLPTDIYNSDRVTSIVNHNQQLSQIYNTFFVNGELQIDSLAFAPTGTLAIPSKIGPNDVKRIGSGAFTNQTQLSQISIPASVTFISTEAFKNCPNLTSVTIPWESWMPYRGSCSHTNKVKYLANENYHWYKCTSCYETFRVMHTMNGPHVDCACGLVEECKVSSWTISNLFHTGTCLVCNKIVKAEHIYHVIINFDGLLGYECKYCRRVPSDKEPIIIWSKPIEDIDELACNDEHFH